MIPVPVDVKPSRKNPSMEAFMKRLLGFDRSTAIRNRQCTTCSESVRAFRDAVCLQEFTISGMCQSCQDGVFGTGGAV